MKKSILLAAIAGLIAGTSFAELTVTRKQKSKIGSSELVVVDVTGDSGGSSGGVSTNTVIDIFKMMTSGTNSPLSGVSANLGTPMVVSNYNPQTESWDVKTVNDYGVRIGENTRGTGNSGDHNQEVVIGRDARSSGTAAISLGPNSESDGSMAIALGWRSAAIGSYSIAIGAGITSGQDYWTDSEKRTEKNPLANQTLAEGEESIAIGHGAHALGSRSIQLGNGTNSTPNSVQINDTLIFKDGKLIGGGGSGTETNDVKGIINESNRPKVIDKTESGPEYDEVTVQSYCINTLDLKGDLEEIAIKFSDTRNYELFIPNTELFRNGLPIGFDTDIEGEVLKLGKWWGKKSRSSQPAFRLKNRTTRTS